MEHIKICAVCGKEFTTERPNKKYCGMFCQASGRKLKRIMWEDRHAHYMTEYMREYRNKGRFMSDDKKEYQKKGGK